MLVQNAGKIACRKYMYIWKAYSHTRMRVRTHTTRKQQKFRLWLVIFNVSFLIRRLQILTSLLRNQDIAAKVIYILIDIPVFIYMRASVYMFLCMYSFVTSPYILFIITLLSFSIQSILYWKIMKWYQQSLPQAKMTLVIAQTWRGQITLHIKLR